MVVWGQVGVVLPVLWEVRTVLGGEMYLGRSS